MHTMKVRGGAAIGALFFTIAVFALDPPAFAQSDYDVSIDTSALSGTDATLTFDLVSGGGKQFNTVTISNFATNGLLVSGGVNAGSVSGALPGIATIGNASFFDELQQGITLGSTISFQVDLTANAPTGGSLPDTFSLFLLDPTASYPLTNTNDPTGSSSLTIVQIDGTPGGNVAAYPGASPAVPISIVAATPAKAPEIDASVAVCALTLLAGCLAVLRGRCTEGRRV